MNSEPTDFAMFIKGFLKEGYVSRGKDDVQKGAQQLNFVLL